MSLRIPANDETDVDESGLLRANPAEDRLLFDRRARALMQMSGEEFLRKLDAGEFARALAEDDNLDLSYLAMIADLGR